ncbi:MAG: hypothetical protein DLM63_05575 [Solirubrobacterales bacterium]|nr:MAG: hypothetical protein DLM63_05575 [Solirubrobacterales bacterium]
MAIVRATTQDAFGVVISVVVAVGLVGALISFLGSRKLYDQIGRGGLSLGDERDRAPSEPSGSAGAAVREEEIRQMLGARNARRARRGERPIDVEAELARLNEVPVDPGLRAEVRDHVIAGNARRVRRGEQPLDVDVEVERRLRELHNA